MLSDAAVSVGGMMKMGAVKVMLLLFRCCFLFAELLHGRSIIFKHFCILRRALASCWVIKFSPPDSLIFGTEGIDLQNWCTCRLQTSFLLLVLVWCKLHLIGFFIVGSHKSLQRRSAEKVKCSIAGATGQRVIEINFWKNVHRKSSSPAIDTILLSQIHNEFSR